MIDISASLLAADYARLGEEMQRAEKAGANSFHFDMMDGHYVPNLALAPQHLTALRAYSDLPFHAHLELANPDDVLSKFAPLEADVIIVQWNTLTDPARTFDRIRSQNMKVGLGFSPDDEIGEAWRFFRELDLLLLLGVYPGFGGQAMQPSTIAKLESTRRMADSSDRRIKIAVDGGVKPGNAASLVQAGADCIVMGTALFGSPDMAGTIQSVRESIAGLPRH